MTRRIFYDLLIAAVLIGFAITVVSSLSGCAKPKLKPQKFLDSRDEEIKDLKLKLEAGYASQQALADEIRAEKQIGEDNWRRIRTLEKDCGFGDVAKGNNNPVFTADRPEDVADYNYSMYSNGDTKSDLPLKVKHIKFKPETYPDVICLDFVSGGQTCFDPMEITER